VSNLDSPAFPTSLLTYLRQAQRAAALTGAGVSAESGVPTFRDAQTGLWARFRPEELASPQAFTRNPTQVWEWYTWRRSLIAQSAPNPAHYALAEMEKRFADFMLITQNVDGLHQQASSRRVIELHGNIWRNKCIRDGNLVEVAADEQARPPLCPRCGGLVRPDVVWFGEQLPAQALEAAWAAARNCDIFLSVGTSSLVQPAASLPLAAVESGAVLVEINPGETPLSPHAHYRLRGPAGSLLPQLLRAAWC
jgi:NAD-dependent deacetylase